MSDWLDDAEAVAEQYADAGNLDARIAVHEQYSTAERDFRDWQFDRFDCPSGARVLGVGCGPADLWVETHDRRPDDWTVVVTDFSPGMVDTAREELDAASGFRFATADAVALPFADDAFDAVTAHHMLYHVPDRTAAIAEFRRVLRPDGALYATTNGEGHLQAIYDVIADVTGAAPDRSNERFSLQNGREQLAPHFDHVRVERYDDALAVTDPDALAAFVCSREDVPDSLAPTFRNAFADRFEDGAFHADKEVGMFVAEP